MRIVLATALALALPTATLAAGGGSSSVATPTCANGKVYDEETKKCKDPEYHGLDTQERYSAVRQLAYAGDYIAAQKVLAHMPRDDDRTLTYLGFTNRKMGNRAAAMRYYTQALRVNPGNVLARSYMGQGMVEDGNVTDAIAQLKAIRAHGGTGTWAEASLRTAIATGRTFNY